MNMSTSSAMRKSPEWLKSGVMYQVFLRAFTPEGTLKAAARKLPEIAKLGADIVYLCPICLQDDDPRKEFWSDRQRFSGTKNPKNPYRIKDFYSIDPEYGSDADLKAFVEAAHKLKLRVILDIVFYHCGPTAVFIESHPDFVKRKPDGSVDYGTWHFPALNYESQGLREYLLKNLEYWIEAFDVDGYRCDVSDAVPLDFWEAARVRIEKLKPEAIVLAEGGRKEDQFSAFDMDYNFRWSFSAHKVFNQGKAASLLRQVWESQKAEYPEGFRFIRYIDNHDIAHDSAQGIQRKTGQSLESWLGSVNFHGIPERGIPRDSRIDKAWGVQAVDALLALCFAIDGIPLIYNGQEAADCAIHSIYDRMPVDWANAKTAEGKARKKLLKELCALRRSEKALAEGSLSWLDNGHEEAVLSFKRVSGSEEILFIVNLASLSLELDLKEASSFKPLLSREFSAKGESCGIGPYGFFIGKR